MVQFLGTLGEVWSALLALLGQEIWRGITAFDVLLAVVILLVGIVVVRYTARALSRVMSRLGVPELVERFLVRLSRFLLYIAVLGLALAPLGVDLTSLALGFGVLGIVVGFALKDVLSNLAAGVLLMIMRPFDKGHLVEIGGIRGLVEDLSINATTLKTFDGKKVIVPSQKVWGSPITNYHSWPVRRIDLVVGISYEDDVQRALEIIRGILDSDERVLRDPGPATNVREFAESSVNLNIFAWVKQEDFGAVRNDLLLKVKAAFEGEGITIPYPTRTIYMHEGS
jgi:small conductance mechanosensitive channel